MSSEAVPAGERPRCRARVLAVLLLAAAPLAAHDVWLEPSAFRPTAGESVEIRLRVGEHFAGDPVPRNDARIVRFLAAGPAGELPVLGADGAEPAGRVRLPQSGAWVLGYRSRPARLELEASKFESYLAEEGLEAILAERQRRGERTLPGRERYSRSVKALLAVGGAGGGDRRLDFTLELLVESDPYSLPLGAELPLRLLFSGEPLAGAQVVALAAEAPDAALVERTDGTGRVRFRLERRGAWLVKAVHMVRADGEDAEWESFWASTTFAIGAEAGR